MSLQTIHISLLDSKIFFDNSIEEIIGVEIDEMPLIIFDRQIEFIKSRLFKIPGELRGIDNKKQRIDGIDIFTQQIHKC